MIATQESTAGTITNIINHGTIVVVFLTTEDGQSIPVHFDHRPFNWLLQGENCTPSELLGRPASFDGEHLRFED